MKRKSVKIAELITEVNRRNKSSVCPPNMRAGWNCMLESVLHINDVYAGFGYYEQPDVPVGHLPGYAGNGVFPDPSRRFYYIAASLK